MEQILEWAENLQKHLESLPLPRWGLESFVIDAEPYNAKRPTFEDYRSFTFPGQYLANWRDTLGMYLHYARKEWDDLKANLQAEREDLYRKAMQNQLLDAKRKELERQIADLEERRATLASMY